MIHRRRTWLGAALLSATLSIGCAAAPAPMAAQTVKAGSMARFIAYDGYLYALNEWELKVYLAQPGQPPRHLDSFPVPAEVETLFPYGELLFLGTRQGMLVYSIARRNEPELIGQARHIYSCDPVVVERDIAYVTLRDGSRCQRGVNALLVFDVTTPSAPKELTRMPMSSPHGLGVDGDTLFVADAEDGLLVIDVRDPQNPQLMGKAPGVKGYDVIAHAGTLFVSADDGLYQYAYGPEGITQAEPLSRIPIGPPPPPVIAEPMQMATDPEPPK